MAIYPFGWEGRGRTYTLEFQRLVTIPICLLPNILEPHKRIELSTSAWKAEVLPLNECDMVAIRGIEPRLLEYESSFVPDYTAIGTDARIRTLIDAFGERCPTVGRHRYEWRVARDSNPDQAVNSRTF